MIVRSHLVVQSYVASFIHLYNVPYNFPYKTPLSSILLLFLTRTFSTLNFIPTNPLPSDYPTVNSFVISNVIPSFDTSLHLLLVIPISFVYISGFRSRMNTLILPHHSPFHQPLSQVFSVPSGVTQTGTSGNIPDKEWDSHSSYLPLPVSSLYCTE